MGKNSGYTPLKKKQWRALLYNYDDMLIGLSGDSCLVCLTDFQIAWLQANVDYMRWSTRWENLSITKNDLNQMADDLELALMTCIDIQPWMLEFNYNQAVGATLQNYDDAYTLGGIPELNPNTPTDFYSGDDSTDRLDALCTACNIYCTSYAQNWISTAQTVLNVIFVIGLVSRIAGVGGLIAGVVLKGLALITTVALNAMQDETALDNVICCMNNALDGLAINQANFETALDSCNFVVGSNEAIIRDIIASDLDNFDNWLSFINALGDAYVLAQVGVTDCPCYNPWSMTWLNGNGNPAADGWTYLWGVYNPITLEIDWTDTGTTAQTFIKYVFTGPSTITKMELSGRTHMEQSTRSQVVRIYDDNDVLIQNTTLTIDSTPPDQNFTVIKDNISQAVDVGWYLIFGTGATMPNGESFMETMLVEGIGTNPF